MDPRAAARSPVEFLCMMNKQGISLETCGVQCVAIGDEHELANQNSTMLPLSLT
jgi:hypothetical protein